MIRRFLLALACLLVWASPSQAAIACTALTDFQFNSNTGTTITLTLPTTPSAGAFNWVAIYDRSDITTTIVSVNGATNGAYTLDQGPSDNASAARAWTYYFPNAAAVAEVITVTFSGSINSQIVGGWCTGAATSTPKDAGATLSSFVTTTTWTTNNATATVAGAIFGACWTATNSVTWTINDGSTILETGGSGQRIHPFFRVIAAGAVGFNLTPNSSISGSCIVSAFKEPAAASTSCCGFGLPRILTTPGIRE